MIVGKQNCDACGCDCTPPQHLWGFQMAIRGQVNPSQSKDLEKVQEEFGKKEFVFCWGCTARAMGANPLKKEEEKREEDKPFFRKAESKPEKTMV